jgi:hypothetical protein
MASKTVARRKTTEEEVAPQSQMLYGKPSVDRYISATTLIYSSCGRDDIDYSSCQTS